MNISDFDMNDNNELLTVEVFIVVMSLGCVDSVIEEEQQRHLMS